MDAATLADLMGNNPEVDYERWVSPYNTSMLEASINTVPRSAMYGAMLGEESGGLHWMEELGDGSEYNGRTDLGNTEPGDGPRFKGRGPIQITGRSNYGYVSAWAFRTKKPGVLSSTFFVDHPDLLGADKFVMLGPVWYWTIARPMNTYADAMNIVGATQAVNGGLNGLSDREARWHHGLAMGNAILPTLAHAIPTDTENEMKIAIDTKTGRRYLCNGVDRPKYLSWDQLKAVRAVHTGLGDGVRISHDELVTYDRALSGVHK